MKYSKVELYNKLFNVLNFKIDYLFDYNQLEQIFNKYWDYGNYDIQKKTYKKEFNDIMV